MIPEPVKTPPTFEEIETRLAKVRTRMEREGMDYYVAAHTDNVYYLTNFSYIPFERPFFLIVPITGPPVMVLPLLEVSHARQRVIGTVEYRTYDEFPAPAGRGFDAALGDLLPAGKKVGVESSLSLALREAVPGTVVISDVIEQARLVKTEYEVGRLVYASQVCDFGLSKVLELSKPGAQQMTVYSEGSRAMWGMVLMDNPAANILACQFLCAVWPGDLSAQPHSIPGFFDTFEEGGPNVTIVTARADGYAAEVERTFFMDRVPEDAKKPFEVMMEARRLAYDLARPGASAADLDEAVLKLIEDRGYGPNILHRTGHGFGVTGHEGPWIAKGGADVLEENMVISIEPGIYIPETGGFRHSDTVLITNDGPVSLTRGDDELEKLVL